MMTFGFAHAIRPVLPFLGSARLPGSVTRRRGLAASWWPLLKSSSSRALNLRMVHNAPDAEPGACDVLEADRILRTAGWRPTDRVVVFDGVCVMCNGGVDFLLRWDKTRQFKYAALQSEPGRALVRKYNAPHDLSTMVYIEDDAAHTRSEAVLRIGARLGLPFSVPARIALFTIPRSLRDWLYTHVVAKHRYALFGKLDTCRYIDDNRKDDFLS